MKVNILAAAGSLVIGLAAADEAQAAACNCTHVRPAKVAHHHARRPPAVRTEIVYGDPHAHRAPSASAYGYGVNPPEPAGYAEPFYAQPPYAGYDYGYSGPVVYGLGWAGYYRPYGYGGSYGYRTYGYRPYGHAGYGWSARYPGGGYRRGLGYRGGYAGRGAGVYVGGAGWRR